jgi:polyhydroxyalkanoate synthesis regulator phasin
MDVSHKRKVAAGTAAALALAGGGAAIAAKKLGFSSSSENKAVVNDAAKQLGVQPTALSNAIKKALSDRVDAAVAAGRLTKEQGAKLKQRIQSGQAPLFGVPGGFNGGHMGHVMGIDAAATYLGLTKAQVDSRLESGKTLAQIAKDENKSVDGLITALKDDAKQKLDDAVSAGRLTKAQEEQILSDLDQRITDLVNGKMTRPSGPPGGFGFGDGPGSGGGPPAGFPGAAA